MSVIPGITITRAFGKSLRGELVLPGDPGYDVGRRVWNGMIDRHPAMIAWCADDGDVIKSVDFARSHSLLVAVRGGGHNVAGNAVCDNGIVIDLSRMKGVEVDAAAREGQQVGPAGLEAGGAGQVVAGWQVNRLQVGYGRSCLVCTIQAPTCQLVTCNVQPATCNLCIMLVSTAGFNEKEAWCS